MLDERDNDDSVRLIDRAQELGHTSKESHRKNITTAGEPTIRRRAAIKLLKGLSLDSGQCKYHAIARMYRNSTFMTIPKRPHMKQLNHRFSSISLRLGKSSRGILNTSNTSMKPLASNKFIVINDRDTSYTIQGKFCNGVSQRERAQGRVYPMVLRAVKRYGSL